MTATNVTLDEQIDYVRRLLEQNQPNPVFTLVNQAILATLQSIKDAGDVVEPKIYTKTFLRGSTMEEHDVVLMHDYDTLLAKYKRACVERGEALANHKAAEENVSDLMAEAFAVTPVAGGHAVRAAEDSLSAAGESPAFTKWCRERYGDVRPIFWPVLLDAFNTGAEKADSEREQFRKDAERYRWLRDNTCENILYERCGIEGSDVEVMISGEELDSAIDSARNK